MKRLLTAIVFLVSFLSYAQNITVDSQTFTPQQLVEDILIDSDCITNVVVTNVIGGDFNGAEQSYGYFDAGGTTFPFESGLVLSTGRLANVPGPNNSLSDDNAPNWQGDDDLETALNESGTTNATIIEFDFTSVASQVSFRYLFASEEYQENNPNSCQFSDLFGFLIRPAAGQEQYENIALVPDTNTPVKATTVTPGVPGSCPPENETYFGSYNGTNSPINFNGQTAVLTATANINPNETYHVKLVIADEQNFRYDSAVFLEAGSFQLSTDLGPNRLIANGTAICEGETVDLNAFQNGQNTYEWYRDGVLVQGASLGCGTCGIYTVTEPGTYTVEVGFANNCISFGEVEIEYASTPTIQDTILIECDIDDDNLTTFDLYDAESDLTANDSQSVVIDFYLTEMDAIDATNAILNPTEFQNTVPFQVVYARVLNQANCFDIAELELQTSNNTLNIPDLDACNGDIQDGFADFTLSDIRASIVNQIPTGADVTYYETEADAFNDSNALPNSYENTIADSQILFVKVESNNQCFSISTVTLNVLYTPVLEEDETIYYCTNTFPEAITIFGGVLNDSPNNYFYEWSFNGVLTDVTTLFNEVNEVGTYSVTVTDPNGCSSSRTITLLASNTPTIESIEVSGIAPNNSITINISGDGTYEYALDDSEGLYQQSNVFTNVSRGFHTIYINDLNGCGITEETILVLGFPKFFTPNGDTVNDTWQILGFSNQFNELESVRIFNRYGKLITVLNSSNLAWDGTFNGKDLPSSDYWFIAKFLDGKTHTGHFTLKR